MPPPQAPLPPPPPPSVPVHHAIKPVFSPSTPFRPPSQTTASAPVSTPEIRRQPLNGTGVLSAFYDSKCYRCNICKFITITRLVNFSLFLNNLSLIFSSKLLQHLFTHIFFCHQCSFYSYSQHNLYQHVFEKHHSIPHTDITDPKSLELLYITRCSDGTFALCMDSSSPAVASAPVPPQPQPPATISKAIEKAIEKAIDATDQNIKPKAQKRKPRQKKVQDNEIVVLSEKREPNPEPLPSSSSTVASSSKPTSLSVIPKRPANKEKPNYTYVLMKHRRCYGSRHPPCLHPLSLEYNICREHTIRHMCHTQGIHKRRKFKPKPMQWNLIDEVALCLKTVINNVVEIEEDRLEYSFMSS